MQQKNKSQLLFKDFVSELLSIGFMNKGVFIKIHRFFCFILSISKYLVTVVTYRPRNHHPKSWHNLIVKTCKQGSVNVAQELLISYNFDYYIINTRIDIQILIEFF